MENNIEYLLNMDININNYTYQPIFLLNNIPNVEDDDILARRLVYINFENEFNNHNNRLDNNNDTDRKRQRTN
jgi:hypothetical protein